MKDPRIQGFLTVMRVENAPDLSTAKVYVSMLGGDNTTGDAVKALNRAAGHVRSEIAAHMHIRRAPELHFVADASAAYAAHINEVIADLHRADADKDSAEKSAD